MTQVFENSRLKLHRAKSHLSELAQLIDNHVRASPPEVSITYGQLDNGHEGYRIRMGAPALPRASSAMIGDVIHNLRAALDLMAVELVERRGLGAAHVYFPFASSADDFDRVMKARNFERAGNEAVELMRGLAPYKGGNTALRGLHDLDIYDKHKAIIPTGMLMKTPDTEFVEDGTFPNGLRMQFVPGSDPVVSYGFPTDADIPFSGLEIVPTLEELVQQVEGVLDTFSLVAVEPRRDPLKRDEPFV